MKKRFVSICTVAAAINFSACNNTGSTADNKDTTAPTVTATNTESSTPITTTADIGNYAAMADTVEKNSQQGYYLNPKTGKAYKSLKVDKTSGRISDETGEPVWRYVDNRNWWVYGGDNWEHSGDAKMEGNKLLYKGDADKWVSYDDRWMKDDETMMKKVKISDNGMKQKMVTEDGDKIKIKTDEEGNTKIKVNDQKIKMDKDGKVIKD